MDAMEALLTRRSIRRFTPEPVSDADLERILRAAMAAPSAGNLQPWHFVTIRERATLDAIPAFHPYAAMLAEAPLCIAVCGELALQKYEGHWVLDVSAATENLLLAAHALGLGAVWLGVYPVAERRAGVRRLLNLPDGVECLSLVAVGHPREPAPPLDRFQPARIHAERW